MLTHLLRISHATDASPAPEDIFAASLGTLFTDDLRNQHGDPGALITYRSRAHGAVELGTADPADETERTKFAHYLWNAGVLMAELMGGARGQRVLELGAGVGLAGIVSVLNGADEVVISDYPAPEILSNLSRNVARNVPSQLRARVAVHGHEWGDLTSPFSTAHAGRFTRILAADCLWMPHEHGNLARSMLHFLSPEPEARVFVIAGFHTGRAKMAPFFDVVLEEGLEIDVIFEMDAEGRRREWAKERDGGAEDHGERKKWLVVAQLKRRQQQ
ncbi:hypothetical protein K490DRAFT_32985 [Saccharata proteae CBS 121410]|uniref:Nicotinamide N-methyltransferase n=1 Tax=Saccharata proteae CBS 121410 TaxID=1314787 RepID=A0A9P4I4M7_9PEZI|nr:hypothetical protein K490DRAFT_32985 [Saccharata proteae CBS 121410]